jgi:hypothetical protein
MQEKLPSLQVVNEHFEAIFNNATATQVINQRFSKIYKGLGANIRTEAFLLMLRGYCEGR